jgi:hypothetical protein
LLDAGRDPGSITVVDPACGTGNFLLAAAQRLGTARNLVGVDTDARAVVECRRVLGREARVEVADAFTADLADGSFDVVVGNPPFLTKLRRATAGDSEGLRTRRERLGARFPPYIDDAALFLVLACRLARPDGGHVAFVQPLSTLAARDAGWARDAVLAQAALEHLWIATGAVFAAEVPTCAVGLRLGGPQPLVIRTIGTECAPLASMAMDATTWSTLLADAFGVPSVALRTDRCIGDVAAVSADFRDEFYEIASLVVDGGEGAPVLTTGLIDPGHSRWGEIPATIGGRKLMRPAVPLPALSDRLRQRLVPKVVVATQTRVIEAAVDTAGAWLPTTPIVSAVAEPDELWPIAAALCSPPLSAWAATRHLGAARSSTAIKLSAREVRALPLPPPSPAWDDAAHALRAGDLLRSGRLMCDAYGVDDVSFTWWKGRLPRRLR